MKFLNKIFQTYVLHYTSQSTRSEWSDSTIREFSMSENQINATVKESAVYKITINFTTEKVKNSYCSCSFDGGPVCKHIVNVLRTADYELSTRNKENAEAQFDDLANSISGFTNLSGNHAIDYSFEITDFSELTNSFILKRSAESLNDGKRGFLDLNPVLISKNSVSFNDTYTFYQSESVGVTKKDTVITLSCRCKSVKKKMCPHQVQALYNLKDREEIRLFFDDQLRVEKLQKIAADYGLENEPDLDDFFEMSYKDRRVNFTPKIKELIPLNERTKATLQNELLPIDRPYLATTVFEKKTVKTIIVFGQHRYYDYLFVELLEAKISKDGNIKNPLTVLSPLDYIWKSEKNDEIKFYSGLVKFQNNAIRNTSLSDHDALKAIVTNPLQIETYYHDPSVSDNLTSSSVIPVELKFLEAELILIVNQKDKFYDVTAKLDFNGKLVDIKEVKVKYDHFILKSGVLYLIENPDIKRVIHFFRKHHEPILIHASKFEEFQREILVNLERKVKVQYSFLKPATKKQIRENGFESEPQKIIYLSDSEDYIQINPVIRYGNVEVSVFSKRQLFALDILGGAFEVQRNSELENQVISMLLRQHADFEEQMNLEYFYVHRKEFLDAAWFLDVFEEWRIAGITILGFNTLKNNKINHNKAQVSVSVASGLDWFDTSIQLKFGDQNVSLKQLQKSVKNRSKFVELGDGTLGLLPEEWIEKFSNYFRSGEVVKETLRTSKMNFSEVSELYDFEMLDEQVFAEIETYKTRVNDFQSIQEIAIPKELNAELREYQKEGLNWLNFLDEFQFGGCLADDMGLGKTIQIIAFILSQREKGNFNTNLIVVPTSLIFNWQAEVKKFAPSIKIHTIYGSDRNKNTSQFDEFEIILTSYGTLLSDIYFLKEYMFNYVFLDESQAIKNPESQRYKAVRLLNSRNKVVLTGTPIENNTFDLYGQFSFACPGLLGSKQSFKDIYSIPIDKFKETKRAMELQRKINPFLLRRTKKQVATELPDKTEMVLYCEMGDEQRRIYDLCKQEFREYLMATRSKRKNQDAMHILAGLTKLRQICNSPALLNDQEYYGDESAKIQVLMEEINARSGEHKIIVFSQFVTMLDLIRTELDKTSIQYEYLTGQTKDRSSKVEAFQTKNEIRVFLISLKAGGTGLNLTEADYVYLVDPWWNPAVENQAIDRCYRIGQNKNVVAVRLISPDTIEEKIMKLQESKKELVNDLIKTDESVLKSLSRDDLMELFD